MEGCWTRLEDRERIAAVPILYIDIHANSCNTWSFTTLLIGVSMYDGSWTRQMVFVIAKQRCTAQRGTSSTAVYICSHVDTILCYSLQALGYRVGRYRMSL